MKNFLYLSILALPLLCFPQKENLINKSKTSKILFLNYEISSNHEEKILLKNKIITDGIIKPNHQHDTLIGNQIKIAQLDSNQNEISCEYRANPLKCNLEYFEESGLISRKKIVLEKIDFNIRLQLLPKTEYISISQPIANDGFVKNLISKIDN